MNWIGRRWRRPSPQSSAATRVLRTSFSSGSRGLEQTVAPLGGFALPAEDIEAETEEARRDAALVRIRDETTRPFDLGRGPLLRARLLRLSAPASTFWSSCSAPRRSGDGWSIGIFTRELAQLYAGEREGRRARLADLPVSYADYSSWQRKRFDGELLRAATERWRDRLGGLEPLRLPFDPAPAAAARLDCRRPPSPEFSARDMRGVASLG